MSASARPILYRVLLAAAALCLAFAAVVGLSWAQDRQRLRETAVAATASARTEDQRLATLLHWVYANQGFAKNHGYFLWKKLDATPIQILEKGGDCEDKSKLFATMLREIGVESSLAMLYPSPGAPPSHVVTLVKTPTGWTPMDAVYDLAFPAAQGGYRDIAVIKADPNALLRRLDTLVAARGASDKIARYQRVTENYPYVTTLNWDKNAATRAVASLIRATGGEPWRTPRPLFLDDPKQFFMLLGLGGGAGLGVLALIARPRRRAAA